MEPPLRIRKVRELLVVLAVQKARDVDRVALVARLVLFDLRLGGAACDVRHALEQRPARVRRRFLSFFLIRRRSDRRSADRAGQDVVGAEQQLFTFLDFRKLGLDLGRRFLDSGRRRSAT